MKVAIVHDWFVDYSGSERVVEQLLCLYPWADLFALVDFLGPEERGFLGGRVVATSFIQRLPLARKRFRNYLSLMPLAVEQFDLSDYELVISSSHAVAKGVITGPDQVHVSYVHSPMRYAWDLQHQYLRESGLERGLKSAYVRWVLHKLRIWDLRASFSVDRMVANSGFVARRIAKLYRREAVVVHPPVNVAGFAPCGEKEDFYVTVSRLVPYKRVDLLVRAFARMPERRLVVIGDGPQRERLQRLATNNVHFLGFQPFDVVRDRMQRAKAFLFAAEEDFGITPVEAQACGTPVIAYGKGGVLESVVEWKEDADMPTGLFFQEQRPEAVVAAVERFEKQDGLFDPLVIRRNAERFVPERFRAQMDAVVRKALEK